MKKHLSLLFLLLFAGFSIYAIAGADPMINVYNYPLEYAFKQLQWYIIGFIVLYCLTRFKLDDLYHLAWPFYIASLIAVWLLAFQHQLTIHGIEAKVITFSQYVNGATSWFNIPKIGTVQPSEFLKVALIIVLAKIISKHQTAKQTFKSDCLLLLKVAVVVLPAMLGIFLQNDTGVMMILVFATIMILFGGGLHFTWFIVLGVGIVILGALLLNYLTPLMQLPIEETSYKVARILGWLDPEKYYSSYGYQLFNAQLSYASSGLFGHGFQSIVMAFPEPQTDFIFAVLVLDSGYLGGLGFLITIVAFDTYLVYLSKKATTFRDCLVIDGLLGLLFFQQFWNIGMVLGLLPITGITLPFISYGGSSLLSYMILMAFIYQIEANCSGISSKVMVSNKTG